MQVSPGLAGILVSKRMSKAGKLTAMEVSRLGGEINYRGFLYGWDGFYRTGWYDGRHIVTTLIGCEWTGGDDGLKLLKKLGGLRFVILTRSSGVSKPAVDKLKKEMPKMKVISVHKSPSPWYSPRCSVTMRNTGKKEVALFHLNQWGSLQGFARLKPGEQIRRTSGIGKRYEAHLGTTKDPNKAKPISRFVANPNAVWDIKSL